MVDSQGTTSFTLTFGAVTFCLAPKSDSQGNTGADAKQNVLTISSLQNDSATITLNNFSGVLRVKNTSASGEQPVPTADASIANAEEDNIMADASSVNNDNDVEASTSVANPVEDMPSPETKDDSNSCIKQKKGQQTLNFFGKSSKSTGAKPKVSFKRGSGECTVPVQSRKKTRSRDKSDGPVLLQKEEEDIDEEPRFEESEKTTFTLASLGQTMPSQESDHSLDEAESAETSEINTDNTNVEEKIQPNDNDAVMNDNFSFNVDELSRESIGSFSFITEQTPDKAKALSKGSVSPCARWGMSMTMIDHKRVLVYGGQTIDPTTQTARPLADLFVYDLLEKTWTKPINTEGVARCWHSANFLPDRQLLLCFGGDAVEEKTGKTITTDQVMVLDTEIMLWYPPTVSGQVPSGRSGHSASLLHKTNELVVFGGVKNGKWLNSLSVLDTNRWKWSTPKTIGDAPPPRSYHRCVVTLSRSC